LIKSERHALLIEEVQNLFKLKHVYNLAMCREICVVFEGS